MAHFFKFKKGFRKNEQGNYMNRIIHICLLFLIVNFFVSFRSHAQDQSRQDLINLFQQDNSVKKKINELNEFMQEKQRVAIPEEKEPPEEQNQPVKESVNQDKISGVDKKLPFGYDIFNYPVETFEPYDYGSVDPDYPIGPNDEIQIYLWGDVELYHQLKVNREGKIIIPEVGMVYINGLTLEQAQKEIETRMAIVYSGIKNRKVYADISLGKLKKIKIFVLGEAKKPGGYLISSVSMAFNALYHAGGPSLNGTLRNIYVLRRGEKIATIDVYDYILKGNNTNDLRLQNGDIINIPYVGNRVTIQGAVLSPSTYELKDQEGLKELIRISGGCLPDAYSENVHIERKIENSVPIIIDIHLKQILNANSNFVLQNGDVVTIPKIINPPINYVQILGEILVPGKYEIKSGMTLNGLVEAAGGLLKTSYDLSIDVSRIIAEAGKDSIILFKVKKEENGFENFLLRPSDIVFVRKNPDFLPQKSVIISGEVYFPGEYALMHTHEKLSSLIDRAGGLKTSAYFEGIEFIRRNVGRIDVNLKQKDGKDEIELHDGDSVHIPEKPATIKVYGEVLFPTNLMYEYNNTVDNYIKRAGGFTDNANKKKVVLTLANGRVIERKKFLWFKKNVKVQPGLTIFVPVKSADKVDWSEMFKNTTTIALNMFMLIFLTQRINDMK